MQKSSTSTLDFFLQLVMILFSCAVACDERVLKLCSCALPQGKAQINKYIQLLKYDFTHVSIGISKAWEIYLLHS